MSDKTDPWLIGLAACLKRNPFVNDTIPMAILYAPSLPRPLEDHMLAAGKIDMLMQGLRTETPHPLRLRAALNQILQDESDTLGRSRIAILEAYIDDSLSPNASTRKMIDTVKAIRSRLTVTSRHSPTEILWLP